MPVVVTICPARGDVMPELCMAKIGTMVGDGVGVGVGVDVGVGVNVGAIVAVAVAVAVAVGLGVPLHGTNGDAELRATGIAVAKSAELLSVSVQPFVLRISAVEFPMAGAGAGPSKKFAVPYP